MYILGDKDSVFVTHTFYRLHIFRKTIPVGIFYLFMRYIMMVLIDLLTLYDPPDD